MSRKGRIETFGFHPGRVLAGKYQVVSCLGTGWEGEVYQVVEVKTKIERAIKLFFPHRGNTDKLLNWYAKKLHKLRSCKMVIQYQAQDSFRFCGSPVSFLVSEFVEGLLLSEFLKTQPGRRVGVYEGLHLLYALTKGMESIHHLREYHGDLHMENIIVCRRGLAYQLKVLDLYHWSAPKRENIQDDVCDLIRIFYDVIGGSPFYRKHPQVVKDICCGLKKSLINSKFKTAGHLRKYLELIEF